VAGPHRRPTGPTLLHCHIRHHLDYGSKALMKYACRMILEWFGTPEWIRTTDLLLRRQTNRFQSFLRFYPGPWFFNNPGSVLSLSRQPQRA
jgi:hypothetical protein